MRVMEVEESGDDGSGVELAAPLDFDGYLDNLN